MRLSRRAFLSVLALAVLSVATVRVYAQAPDGDLSEKEIDSLRDAAYIPNDRIAAYESILNDREREIDDLLKRPHHVEFPEDMHDVLDQFGAIADELNDNLDEFQSKQRDVRKSLPKLLTSVDRWSAALRAPADDDAYNVVRRIALDTLKDMHDLATQMLTDQTAYFKAHPGAAAIEKERANENHAPVPNESPH